VVIADFRLEMGEIRSKLSLVRQNWLLESMQRVVEPSAVVRGSCFGRIHPGGLLGEDGRVMVG
jgi:hypothetical protein